MKKFGKLALCLSSMLALVACGNTTSSKVHEEFLGSKNTQTSFEEDYIKAKGTYSTGEKFAVQLIGGIAIAAAGAATDSPATFVSGLVSIINSCNDNLIGNKGPTTADVMNKLKEMDQKLDMIGEKLEKNYNQLSTETVRTQAMVNEVMLEEQEKAISSFNTNYAEKIDDFRRDYSDYLEQSCKAYVKESRVMEFKAKSVSDSYSLVPFIDYENSKEPVYTINVEEFPKAKAYLDKNYDTVGKGFIDRMYEDIEDALNGANLPIAKETAVNLAYANLMERFTRDYYKDNHNKALEIRNLAINYAKQINGKSTKSVAERYVSRMKYMFNFAGEMREPATGALANLAHQLDVNAALAAQACLFAGVNEDEIKDEYLTARDAIRSEYDKLEKYGDNYCFLAEANLGGNFYRAKFDTSYENKGNEPKFKSNFKLERVVAIGKSASYYEEDINKHTFVEPIDHARIVTRMKLMKENGLVPVDMDYIGYLTSAKVMGTALATFTILYNEKWITEDAYRIITGYEVRSLGDGDKNLALECNECGTPGADYFHVGWKGTYKGSRDGGCWKGNIAESTFIDARNGEILDEKKIAAYATYDESHWTWFTDEHWSFVDNPYGNYFFALEKI
ncbi:MAG: hypothetical protein MJ238_03740 [Bacilli bacterium]|nr:hypothetical protein [Bacilli bacterium]